MELKCECLKDSERMLLSSNRTFMELKFLLIKRLTACLLGSNRTFMELKCQLREAEFLHPSPF